jgi:hypothetical protein
LPRAVAGHFLGVGSAHGEGRRRRRPETTVLHRVVRRQLPVFLARADADTDGGLPRFVRREFAQYLDCGMLWKGLARVHCLDCGKDDLVAFACKGRGFCPSCGGRRMADTAAFLVDRVLPRVKVRQWVLSLPYRVRLLCAYEPWICTWVRRVFVTAVLGLLRRRAKAQGVRDGRSGAVVFAQRFDSALRLNLHFHALVLDGVYERESGFVTALQLGDSDVAWLVRRIATRVIRGLRRRGRWPDPEADVEHAADEPWLLQCQAAAVQGLAAFGPQAGARVQRVVEETAECQDFVRGRLCAECEGFSLHAKVTVGACARERLEKLCRYVARPSLSQERLTELPDGRVVYELKRRWRDGTTHVVMTPQVLLERLAALVPRPRRHLVTYHGVLGPAAKSRREVVPSAQQGKGSGACAHARDEREPSGEHAPPRPRRRYPWAELMRRVFAQDVLVCRFCGGPRRVLDFVVEPDALRRILGHLGLETGPPRMEPARGPPELPFADAEGDVAGEW